MSAAQFAADQARERQQAVVGACRDMWEDVADRDQATQDAVAASVPLVTRSK